MLRRSRQITLVLIGAAALPGCSPGGPTIVHDRYASLEDCTADWGRPESCDREDSPPPRAGVSWGGGGGWGGPGTGGGVVFRGPDYPVGERSESQLRALRSVVPGGSPGAMPSGPVTHAIEHAVPSLSAAPSRGGFGSMSHFFGRLG